MRVQPINHLPLFKATYIVGCDTEDAKKIWIDAENAIAEFGDYNYIAFFDASGDKMGEVKIVEIEDLNPGENRDGIWFEFETEY